MFQATPTFLTGGALHPYQLDGLNWLLMRHKRGQNMILAVRPHSLSYFFLVFLVCFLVRFLLFCCFVVFFVSSGSAPESVFRSRPCTHITFVVVERSGSTAQLMRHKRGQDMFLAVRPLLLSLFCFVAETGASMHNADSRPLSLLFGSVLFWVLSGGRQCCRVHCSVTTS